MEPSLAAAFIFQQNLETPLRKMMEAVDALRQPDEQFLLVYPDVDTLEARSAAFAGCAIACRQPLQEVTVAATLLTHVDGKFALEVVQMAVRLNVLLDRWAFSDDPEYGDMSDFLNGLADLMSACGNYYAQP